jgi:hypothetical protein
VVLPEGVKGKVDLEVGLGNTLPVHVPAGKMKMRSISLLTSDMLVDKSETTTIPMTIKAYAEEDKDRVVIERTILFMFPAKKEIEALK